MRETTMPGKLLQTFRRRKNNEIKNIMTKSCNAARSSFKLWPCEERRREASVTSLTMSMMTSYQRDVIASVVTFLRFRENQQKNSDHPKEADAKSSQRNHKLNATSDVLAHMTFRDDGRQRKTKKYSFSWSVSTSFRNLRHLASLTFDQATSGR